MLITLRRSVALTLAVPLLVVLSVGLLSWQLEQTLLSPDYLKHQLVDAQLYGRVYEEAVDATVERALVKEENWLPAELEAVNLPEDDASRAQLRALVVALIPPQEFRQNVEAVLDGLVPWLTGRAESFDIRISMHTGMEQAFGRRDGRPSLFEETWRNLGMSELVIRALSDVAAAEDESTRSGEPNTIEVLGEDLPAASAWLDEQLGVALDEMVPYLVGDRERFRIAVSFDAYPALTVPLAETLESSPDQLLKQGWTYSDADVRERIGEGANLVEADIDRKLALFRPAGLSITDADLLDQIAEERATASADSDAPPDLEMLRTWVARVRLAGLWGGPLAVVVLATVIGLLGGRRWSTRLAWAAGAVAVASVVMLGVATVGYGVVAGPQVSQQAAAFRGADGSRIPKPIRVELAAAFEENVDSIARELAVWTAGTTIAGIVGLAGAIAMHRRSSHAADVDGPPERAAAGPTPSPW